ncbi:hypothetical protein [Cryobacterium sp. Hh11]|nr:hypothetical protein [Cryobacterium sp. Hh11]
MTVIRVADHPPQMIFSHPDDAPLVLNEDGATEGIDWKRIVKESLK